MSNDDIAKIRQLIEAQTESLKVSSGIGAWAKTILGALVAILLAFTGVATTTLENVAIHGVTLEDYARRLKDAESRDIVISKGLDEMAKTTIRMASTLEQIQKNMEWKNANR